MKKTHSANIGGTVFQIEEDAYEKLQDYLQSIHTHFHFYPDVAEIVADIEARIAEQLLQLKPPAQVVQINDVHTVIETMGRIEQFDDAAEQVPQVSQIRKLYRDPDQKVIAGVASGLAAYLGVPALLMRCVMLLLVPLFGVGIGLYLLLWALVPMATSTTEKLQMRGRALTLASIDQGVRDGLAGIPRQTRNMAVRGTHAIGALVYMMVTTLARWARRGAGVLVVGVATATLLVFTVMLVVALVNADAPPLHPGAADFFALFGAKQTAFKFFAYLLFAIPVVLVITTGLRLFWGVNRLNPRGLSGMLAVWVISLLATAGIWSSSYPALSKYMDDYPATAEARRSVERIRVMAATISPLSDEQVRSLSATMLAEYRRRRAEEDVSLGYYYGDPRAVINAEEERLKVRAASNQRIVESAGSYLDAQQIAVMQESMARYMARSEAALQIRRESLAQRDR